MPEPTIGILAYGSLIDHPGEEILEATTETKRNIQTPFHVEFARRSDGRGGAPTLVPVTSGGAPVIGHVFVLNVTEQEAANRLWRREINAVGSTRNYKAPKTPGPNHVVVERLEPFADLDVVLYTQIAATIEPLTAAELARLAIESVTKSDPGRDGITYLIDAKRNGIETALSAAFETEILKQSGCDSLFDALTKLRG